MLHVETVSPSTLQLIKKLQSLPLLQGMRLVGGTSLALQIGHRNSVDIDLFGKMNCDSMELTDALHEVGIVKIIKNSSNINIYQINGVKVDIVNYRYDWLKSEKIEGGIRFAQKEDIAAMKIAAIIGRGTKKDFIDLAHLLEFYKLDEMLKFYEDKYPDGSLFIALKSLSYFEDAENDPMPNMYSTLRWEDCKNRIIENLQ